MQILEHEPLTAGEQPVLQKIAQMLAEDKPVSLLVDGEALELPKAVCQILQQIVTRMAHDRTTFVIPMGPILTTQEAADILGVSRPYLVKLLDEGEIPFTKVGVHRRIHANDLLNYQKKRKEEREQALNEMIRVSEELGLYD